MYTEYKICPKCGLFNDKETNKCEHCNNDITNAPILATESDFGYDGLFYDPIECEANDYPYTDIEPQDSYLGINAKRFWNNSDDYNEDLTHFEFKEFKQCVICGNKIYDYDDYISCPDCNCELYECPIMGEGDAQEQRYITSDVGNGDYDHIRARYEYEQELQQEDEEDDEDYYEDEEEYEEEENLINITAIVKNCNTDEVVEVPMEMKDSDYGIIQIGSDYQPQFKNVLTFDSHIIDIEYDCGRLILSSGNTDKIMSKVYVDFFDQECALDPRYPKEIDEDSIIYIGHAFEITIYIE